MAVATPNWGICPSVGAVPYRANPGHSPRYKAGAGLYVLAARAHSAMRSRGEHACRERARCSQSADRRLIDVEAPRHVGPRFADSKPLDRFLPMMRRQGCVSPLCGENCFVTSVTAVLKVANWAKFSGSSNKKIGLRGSLGSPSVSHPWPLDYVFLETPSKKPP
jgi:hypothetical protein